MEKKHTRWNLSKALETLCQSCPKSADKLCNFQKNKKWKPNERQQLLFTVSELFLLPECTASICCYLQPLILDIVERIRTSITADDKPNRSQLLKLTLALSVAVRICPDIKGFALNFIKEHKPLTSPKDDLSSSEPKKKKSKTEKMSEISICRGIWYLLQVFKHDIHQYIDTNQMMSNLSTSNKDIRWFSSLNICELLNMSSYEKELFLRKYFTVEEEHEMIIRDFTEEQQFKSKYQKITDLIDIDEVVRNETTRTHQQILGTDLNSNVTEVCGVLLSKLSLDNQPVQDSDLVGVPSMLNNLRSLALAVASGNPVLLQGAVGSGKTSIVEHLAHLTGRHSSPQIMKIQLGDQTDSKALLGIYRCTEIPGEFVWQPGILTQAVLQGYWVLLEDIDYAPMDVVSVLLPLLENHTLSIPGHGDNIQASPNFRLFASQRLISSTSGWQKQQAGSSVLLEKMWTKIHIEPLSRSELAQVILSKYPVLESIISRILDVYFLLSAGRHDIDIPIDNLEIDTTGKFLSLDGRLISTRDLMSWCSRISKDFDVKSTNIASRVYQEACDCFISCLSKPEKRLAVAEAIGAKLNITKDQAEYYCNRYKPEINITSEEITVGRVTLPKHQSSHTQLTRSYSTFSFTRQCVSLLEKVGVCIVRNEPVLLVGETGTGKTSSVQFLSQQLGHKLHVVNMNQQSDSTDLLGGFKPVDIKFLIMPFREEFEMLFCKSFSRKQNAKFLGHVQDCFSRRKWSDLLKLIEHTTNRAITKFQDDNDLLAQWQVVERRQKQLRIQIKETENVLAFSFIEGTLVKAIKQGDWVLLDEINLASAETLECLCGLLESTSGSIILTERGDIEPIIRHENFRLFACMNPATDVGKKDLTPGIRNRFTEFYVEELTDENDLRILTSDYLSGLALTASHISGIVKFYSTVRNTADRSLVDGTGHKPHYSLRTLCRALRYAASNPCGQSSRSLYEGFCLSFLTQLDRISHPVVEQLVCKHVIGNSNLKSMLNYSLQCPSSGQYLQFEGYWISQGSLEPTVPDGYILTPSVRANLKDLSRIVSAGEHPVLLQGETSVGKTSLITWLAKSTGNICVRVNNHEHTDLQEYVGCYAADESGKLIFKEGVLVEAMRKGHWIILDELNLAPSDVLEALNRLLDDNRELFIPETQVTVKAHPKFMLFATQNPAGQYGGRKILSRAFRNRFIELHFDEIPSGELETILHLRCSIPQSYSKRLVAVMLDLQTRRRSSGVFAGKQGFMTLRDLFRWAERYNTPDAVPTRKYYDWDQHLADHGYMLLAGRVRKSDECQVIQEVLSKHFKRKVNSDRLFNLNTETSSTTKSLLDTALNQSLTGFQHIVWTHSMRRLAALIGQALKFKEPVLLVGETGCGKTTICQLYAELKGHPLFSVNCHLHTESADFLGGLRPVRSHSMEDDSQDKLFEWVDGPLVQAMKESAMFLIDEISLADDSVLERLNSVLEPERRLLLAEKGGGDGYQNDSEEIVAGDDFRVFATMNPGGDFGKKELSPALRNRFTEIWCPPCIIRDDMIAIIEHNLQHGIYLSNQQDNTSGIGPAIMDFIHWFTNNEIGKRCTVSIRDILSWVNFINICSIKEDDISDNGYLPVPISYIHGACLVFLDSLGSGHTSSGGEFSPTVAKETCIEYLIQQINQLTKIVYTLDDLGFSHKQLDIIHTDTSFTIPPFTITKGQLKESDYEKYALNAPTTSLNALRILRGLQLSRPLLLEGSPGVGKTSLVTAIARHTGRHLVRINLSEQTDVTDLFGADLPVEGEKGGTFAWRDGPLLQALKAGHWVVLDELNLASQSVLEGLNACLDHRGEVYIPELSKTFHIKQDETRIFGCQNPLHQGGGRKGLPRSFLNRFTQVYVEPLERADLLFISQSMYPTIPTTLLSKMVDFNMTIYEETVGKRLWGSKGGPWEFNLRDLFRWCDLLLANQVEGSYKPGEYLTLIYSDRMRTIPDKDKVIELFERVFKDETVYQSSRYFSVNQEMVQVGHSFLPRVKTQTSSTSSSLKILHHDLQPLESIMKCVEMNWMAILVGPQASGKTSIVRLLAELTGQQLHVLPMNSSMDTTELLGGFEQADINRHVDEISSDINILLDKYQKTMLINKQSMSTGPVKKLHQLWCHYTQLSLTGKEASSLEEYRLLIKRIQSLKHILHCLPNIVDLNLNGEIEVLSARLDKTNQSLLQSEPGKGGGAFEWIDSLLVKALINGDWLLIDNVNFCSASVLDRLNALLEPGGVLSVNERGVIDGQIPTIKPHPNFRLFLAMDSKYGEISRAMKNRGVEIYIPGEVDGCIYSRLDILSMLESIYHYHIKHWLISLHDSIKQQLPYTEKPTVTDLLRCGVVIKQQLDKGMCLTLSLQQAAQDVYLRSLKTTSSKKIAADIIQNACKEFSVNLVVDETQKDLVPLMWPGAPELNENITLFNTCQAAGVLSHFIKRYKLSQNSDHQPSSDDINNTIHSISTAFRIFLSDTSHNSMRFNQTWLEVFIQHLDLPDDHIQGEFGFSLPRFISLLPVLYSKCCQLMFNGTVNRQYLHIVEKLGTNQGMNILLEEPWDIETNRQILDKIQLQHPDKEDFNTDMVTMENILQRFYMLMDVGMILSKCTKWLTFLEDQSIKVSTLPSSSLYVLVHVHNFCNNLENVLTSVLMDTESDIHITWFWNNVPYMVYFLSVVKNLKSYPESVFLSRLSLHWNWLYNKLLQPLLSASSTWRPPSVILSSINQLQNIMGQENIAAKQFVKYLTHYGHPKPYTTQSQSDLQRDIRYCLDCLNIYKYNKSTVLKLKVAALVNDGEHLKCLLQSISELFSNSDNDKESEDEIQMKLGKLKCSLIQKNILEEEFESMDTRETTDEPGTSTIAKPAILKQYVELWPVYEHLSILLVYSLMVNEQPQVNVHQLRDFITRYTPSTTVHLINKLDTMEKKELYLLLSEVIMNKMWRSTVTKDSNTWLLWNTELSSPDDGVKNRFRGAGIFHLIPMSYSIYTLLSTKSPDPKDNSYLPLHVSLGSVDDQLNKLHQISCYLWKYSGILSSTRLNIGNIEQDHLLKSFLKMLNSFGVLLTPHSQTKWFDLLTTVEMNYSTKTLTTEDILTVQTYYQEVYTSIEHPALPLISRCFEVVIDILQNNTENTGSGLGLAYIGLASVYLLAPVGPVDPVEKNAIKMKNFENQLVEIDCEIEVYDSNIRLKTGLTVEDIESNKLHPRLQYLIDRKQHLHDKIQLLTNQQAYRPDPLQYLSLVQDVKAYLESICSIERVTSLLSKLQTANQVEGGPHVDEVIITSCLREEEAWQQTQQSFLDSLDKHYWFYPDLIVPFKSLIQQMRLGVSILAQRVETSHKQFTLSKQIYGQSLEEVMLILSQFPNISRNHETFHDLTKVLIYDTTCELVNTSISTNTDSDHIHDVLSKLLLCGLYLIKIHCINSGELTTCITQTLSNLFTTFVTAWQDQETRRREKEAEEASLYRYRSKNHGDDKTDEDKDEDEFKSSFPSFENEYADLVGPQSLEDVGTITEEEYIKSTPYSISIEDMYTVYRIHDLLFTSLITTDWLESVPYSKPTLHDYIQPAMIAYDIASQVATKSLDALGREVDTGVLGGHLLISGVVQQTIISGLNSTEPQTENSLCLKPTEYYDIYYDSNVNQVSQCKIILDRFLARLDELLIEYPQHPTLSQIVAIIRRILSFSITCPIMKFLVGLELLLEKTKDWEANAAKHVSVMTHFKEVSAMVVQWRKLELGCWKNTMLIEERKCEKSVSKWWFHLYQLITSYLHNDSNDQETVESEKLVTSLKEFLEKSNLGEFKYRLKMILAFHCQVYKMDASDKQVEVLNLLWNLYQFYHQYLPNIETEISSQKIPLQKQLKGFVKIARWSDLNYWALKQSTEKTHRTVHKYSKKYQVILNQPITKLLGEKGDNLSIMTSGSGELSTGGVLCDRLEVYRQSVYTQKLQLDKIVVDDKNQSNLLQRLPILIPRLSKHWKTVVKSLPYTQTLKGLDEFTGDVIETVHELQQPEVKSGEDKEKQKSEAKFLNLRKRKSLAELFKYLTKMGLSYRKGLILDDQTKQDNSLSLQPIDITVAKSHYQLSEVLTSQWENCQSYFYRCITRKTQLEQAVVQPAQDLGLGNVERCRGFSHHLHHLFTQQRHELGETFTTFLQIRKFTNEIKRLKIEDGVSLPSQSQVQYWLGRVKSLCLQLLEGLNQYNILLQSCPKPTSSTNILPDITQLSPLSNIKYGDTVWLQTSDKIQTIISRTESEYKKLLKISDKHFLLWKDVKLIEETSQTVKSFSDKLAEISELFTDPVDNTNCALNNPLTILIENITCCISEVEEGLSSDRSGSGEESRDKIDSGVESKDNIDSREESNEMGDITSNMDSLIETVLLVVQKLLSRHPVVEKKSEEEEEEEEEEELEDGYIVKGLIENLKSDVAEIKTQQISTMIKSIIEKTMIYFENKDTRTNGENSIKLLLRCLPLLERYCDITEYFLAHVICSHRCCGKLLSVLLALFTELAMKGFCVPPELSDEMEQEGATEFKDIEQGGLGEGEGVKDVSDQIETEDQLDDTRRAGEEKKEDNDHQDIPAEDNAIEMSEDFEGKPQDLNQEEDEDKDNDDKDDDDEDELDKEMGDIEDKETDKLDEQLWGSDEEEDNESDEKPKDETGPGEGEKEESELVAKDDNLDKSQEKDDKQNDKQQGEEENQKDEVNEMEDIEEEGYNDDKIDANQGDSKEPEPLPETMDLPEDLNLDAEEAGEKEEETEMEDPAEGKDEDADEGTEDADKPEDKEEEEGKDDNQEAEKNDAMEDGEEGEEKKEENGAEDKKDNETDEREDEEGQGDPGFTADDEKVEEEEDNGGKEEEKNDNIDTQGKTQHDDNNIENSETAQDEATQADNEQKEKVGSGMADTQQDEGHEGEKSSEVTQGSNEKQKEMKRQPGKSREDRSLGAPDQSYQRLKTTEETHPDDEEEENGQDKKEGELYEHIKDSKSHHDAQTLDVANDDTEEQMIPNKDQEEVKDDDDEPMEDVKPLDDEDEKKEEEEEIEKKEANKVKGKKMANDKMEDMKMDQDEEMEDREKVEISGERILTMTANRGPTSTIHTAVEHLHIDSGPTEIDVEKIRADLEENVNLWSHQSLTTPEQMAEASSAWQRYEAITSGLSQELCEQLRLILEPSQATKLKGDYRTGKRLNMRKVIPYIASQFRKDKIWLRRSKPSKRQYQIMLAIDDSSSMLDNHSKQLAFESLALISNALTLLEAGDLAVTSFGESVKVLHSFTDQFSSQSGANILHQFTFEQKKTKIAQLLQQATSLMIDGRSRQHGVVGNPETSQLLLIVSDGRGLFSEGMEAVKSAVRKAREANIFLVFVIIDNPENKDSILDIRVPVFKGPGKLPEIKSYMEQFPFPFYIILRDINSLPITLSDALRQWFELVTAADR